MTGDFCGTRYGVRLHLQSGTPMCDQCGPVVNRVLDPRDIERERHTPPPSLTTPTHLERDLRALVALIHEALTTPPDRKAAT